MIDFRSFSSLWFWIALAVMWSTASHWVLGVPWDLVRRARRKGGQAAEDVHLLARIYSERLLEIGRMAGLWLVALVAFLHSSLIVLGFLYRIQFAQALLCLALPMTLVGALSLRAAARITAAGLEGAPLYRALAWHRRSIQAVGVVSIFITSIWGMVQSLRVGLH